MCVLSQRAPNERHSKKYMDGNKISSFHSPLAPPAPPAASQQSHARVYLSCGSAPVKQVAGMSFLTSAVTWF
jgi:hypothetical protein